MYKTRITVLFLKEVALGFCFVLSGGLVAKSCSTLATPRTVALHAPLSMGFSRQEYWSGLLFPSPGDLPKSGIEPWSPALQADPLPTELQGKPLVLNDTLKCWANMVLSCRVFLGLDKRASASICWGAENWKTPLLSLRPSLSTLKSPWWLWTVWAGGAGWWRENSRNE